MSARARRPGRPPQDERGAGRAPSWIPSSTHSCEEYRDLIHTSFIFGSTARLTQKSNSDIDLFIVGNVRLKDLSLTLAEAEKVLGRPINPVIHSKETFLKKLNERDPFLLQVLNGEKIILGGFDDELGAVVSKSAHHQTASDRAPDPASSYQSLIANSRTRESRL